VRHNRLSVAPFWVLATMAREKLDEEEGEARQLVAQCYEDVDAVKKGRIGESHFVANIKERAKGNAHTICGGTSIYITAVLTEHCLVLEDNVPRALSRGSSRYWRIKHQTCPRIGAKTRDFTNNMGFIYGSSFARATNCKPFNFLLCIVHI
jgi:hypothetical protein